jgi:hypothetical protein
LGWFPPTHNPQTPVMAGFENHTLKLRRNIVKFCL